MVKRSRQDSFPLPPTEDRSTPSTAEVSSPASPVSSPPQSSPDHTHKYSLLDDSNSSTDANPEVMRCDLPPHKEVHTFSSYEDYEVHYNQFHVNRCSECRKNFPTPRFLQLHIEENHDPLNEARKARGERIYRCFVEDCDRVCSAPHKRRMHLVDKHMFPKDYNFYIVNDGIDKSSSMLRPKVGQRRRSSAAQRAWRRNSLIKDEGEGSSRPTERSKEHLPIARQPKHAAHIKQKSEGGVGSDDDDDSNEDSSDDDNDDEMETEKNGANKVERVPPHPSSSSVPEVDMSDLTTSMSALRFVPSSIRFGRGRGRGGLSRH